MPRSTGRFRNAASLAVVVGEASPHWYRKTRQGNRTHVPNNIALPMFVTWPRKKYSKTSITSAHQLQWSPLLNQFHAAAVFDGNQLCYRGKAGASAPKRSRKCGSWSWGADRSCACHAQRAQLKQLQFELRVIFVRAVRSSSSPLIGRVVLGIMPLHVFPSTGHLFYSYS